VRFFLPTLARTARHRARGACVGLIETKRNKTKPFSSLPRARGATALSVSEVVSAHFDSKPLRVSVIEVVSAHFKSSSVAVMAVVEAKDGKRCGAFLSCSCYTNNCERRRPRGAAAIALT
jgi:hypothetical protein